MRACLIIFSVLFLTCSAAVAQNLFLLSSLDYVNDAEQIAMGESYVANPFGLTSFRHNPATLAGLSGARIYYSYRDNEIHELFKNSYFRDFGLALATPAGNFGLHYSRFNYLESIITDENGVRVSESTLYDYTGYLTYGLQIDQNFAAGINLKIYGSDVDVKSGETIYSADDAYVIDFGLTYSTPGILASSTVSDTLILGIALQNFGSDHKSRFELGESETTIQLPRYLKLGLTYRLQAGYDRYGSLFEYLLTAQYGRWLNPKSDFDKGKADLGGIGFKVRFYEIFSLQIGGYYQSYFNFYGNEDVLNMRYGFSVAVPFKRLNMTEPVSLIFSYSHVPINSTGGLFFSDFKYRTWLFTAQLEYNLNLW